eukprot:c20667_g1_i2 orf=169-858(+)
MMQATLSAPALHSSASNTSFLHANGNKMCLCDSHLKVGSSSMALRAGCNSTSYNSQDRKHPSRGRVFCTSSGNFEQDYSHPKQDMAPPERTYVEQDPVPQYQYRQMSPTMRRRPYNLEAKMRMKAYRRQALQQQRADAMAEEARTFQLYPDECYKKGDPNTVDGAVTEIIHIGIIVKLANGRDGFLPASQLGCMGGLELMERLFHVGQELTFRVIEVPHVGKDRLFLKR